MYVHHYWVNVVLVLATLIKSNEAISLSTMHGSCGSRPFGPASVGTEFVGPTHGHVVTFHSDQGGYDFVPAHTGIYDTDIDCWLILKGQPNTADQPAKKISLSWRGNFHMIGYGGDNYVDTACDRALVEVYDAEDDGMTLTNRLAHGCGSTPPAVSISNAETFVVHLYVAAKPPDINYTEIIPFPQNNATCNNATEVSVCALNATSCEVDCTCQFINNTQTNLNMTTLSPNATNANTTNTTVATTTVAVTTAATTVVTTANMTYNATTIATTMASNITNMTTLAPCVEQLNITNVTVLQPRIRFTLDFTSYFEGDCSIDNIDDGLQMQCDSGRCIDDTLRCDVYYSPNCGTSDNSDIRASEPGNCRPTRPPDLFPLYLVLGLLAALAMLYWCCWRPGYCPWRLARLRNVKCCKRPCCHPCRNSPACRKTGCCGSPATGACAACSPTCCTGAPGPGGGGGCLGPCSRLPCCSGGPGPGSGGPGSGPKKGPCGCCVPLNGSLASGNGAGWGPNKAKAGGKGGLGPNGWTNFSNDDGAHVRETR
ncbi:unnamed protein product [Owenia fusiformis]|uniref:Uncharacterized protein n=1 Tax=Owenia fusiformis TaxID=6347 RepID=A0A8J1TV69_OWEFU|nr:unnamed protein product [Owenia fusiformis]